MSFVFCNLQLNYLMPFINNRNTEEWNQSWKRKYTSFKVDCRVCSLNHTSHQTGSTLKIARTAPTPGRHSCWWAEQWVNQGSQEPLPASHYRLYKIQASLLVRHTTAHQIRPLLIWFITVGVAFRKYSGISINSVSISNLFKKITTSNVYPCFSYNIRIFSTKISWSSLHTIFFFFFWLYCAVCRILVPTPGIKPMASAVEIWES